VYRNYALERSDAHASLAAKLLLVPNTWDLSDKLAAVEVATPDDLKVFHARVIK
jgi:hypothetical protein